MKSRTFWDRIEFVACHEHQLIFDQFIHAISQVFQHDGVHLLNAAFGQLAKTRSARTRTRKIVMFRHLTTSRVNGQSRQSTKVPKVQKYNSTKIQKRKKCKKCKNVKNVKSTKNTKVKNKIKTLGRQLLVQKSTINKISDKIFMIRFYQALNKIWPCVI